MAKMYLPLVCALKASKVTSGEDDPVLMSQYSVSHDGMASLTGVISSGELVAIVKHYRKLGYGGSILEDYDMKDH